MKEEQYIRKVGDLVEHKLLGNAIIIEIGNKDEDHLFGARYDYRIRLKNSKTLWVMDAELTPLPTLEYLKKYGVGSLADDKKK